MAQEWTVASPSPRMAELEEKRKLTRALLSGTAGMKAAGRIWLPEHPGEVGTGNYEVRLRGNVLTPFVEQAISKGNGKLFAKPIALTDVLPELLPLLENIDLQGRDFNSFAMSVVKSAWADGVSYVLVDKPVAADVKTVADEKIKGIRPYAIHIEAANLLEVLTEMINGALTIVRVRIKECSRVQDGQWGYRDQERVRVLERLADGTVIYQLWEERENVSGGKKEWAVVEEEITAMKRINLVAIYTNRVGFFEGEPAFQATAELNLAHWRVTSELQTTVTMSCFEMATFFGFEEGFVPKVGPCQSVISTDPEAKAGWMSPSGKGAEIAANYLKDIEARVETASANLRIESPGKVTATAAAIDSEETCAGLKAIAECNSDAFELMLQYFAELIGTDPAKAGTVKINDEFGQRRGTDAGLTSLDKALALGKLAEESYWEIMAWRNETPPTFDVALNHERLAAEGPPLSTLSARTQGDI